MIHELLFIRPYLDFLYIQLRLLVLFILGKRKGQTIGKTFSFTFLSGVGATKLGVNELMTLSNIMALIIFFMLSSYLTAHSDYHFLP